MSEKFEEAMAQALRIADDLDAVDDVEEFALAFVENGIIIHVSAKMANIHSEEQQTILRSYAIRVLDKRGAKMRGTGGS